VTGLIVLIVACLSIHGHAACTLSCRSNSSAYVSFRNITCGQQQQNSFIQLKRTAASFTTHFLLFVRHHAYVLRRPAGCGEQQRRAQLANLARNAAEGLLNMHDARHAVGFVNMRPV